MCLKMSPSDELVAVIHKPQDPCKDVSLDFAQKRQRMFSRGRSKNLPQMGLI